MSAADYGIDPLHVSTDPDAVILRAQAFHALSRFAGFGGVTDGDLVLAPQRLKDRNGYNAYVYLLLEDFESLESALPDRQFFYQGIAEKKQGYAFATWFDEGLFLVHRTSTMAKGDAPRLDQEASKHRQQLIRDRIVVDKWAYWEFCRDEVFSTPAAAARVVTGYNKGNAFWKNLDGQELPTSGQRARR